MLGVRVPRQQGAFNVPLTYYDLAQAVPDTNLAALLASAVTITLLTVNNEILKVPHMTGQTKV